MNKTQHKVPKPRYLIDAPQQGQASLQVSSRVAQETIPRTERENTSPASIACDTRTRDIDKDYLVRAISHDVGAHLMLLEFLFRDYDALAQRLATESQTKSVRDTADMVPRLHLAPNNGSVVRYDEAKTIANAPHQERGSQTPKRKIVSPPPDKTALNEAAAHVTACLDEMKRFVNELISFAKTGTIDMEPASVSISELVDEVLFEQRRLIEKHHIHVVVSSPLPTVFANPMRIKQVLTNLIRNAAIHGCDTLEPMIVIASEIALPVKPGHTAMTCFSIRDNGCGIPQAECGQIFEPGYRVPGNQNEGNGIGLAIVKKIACHYGGDVVCHSNKGSTTFSVTLPKGEM